MISKIRRWLAASVVLAVSLMSMPPTSLRAQDRIVIDQTKPPAHGPWHLVCRTMVLNGSANRENVGGNSRGQLFHNDRTECHWAHGQATDAAGGWHSLFQGQDLTGWRSSNFGADGPVKVVDGSIQLGVGEPLTGVTYQGPCPLPRFNYELRLRARRIAGMDFFCGLTFPYGDSHCTLILGGWGGGVVGLSSLGGRDASENETTRYFSFRKNQWYEVRLRVKEGSITAWIDNEQRVICQVAGRAVATRPEVLRSRPLGIASFRTKAEIKDVALRRLDDSEVTPHAQSPSSRNDRLVD